MISTCVTRLLGSQARVDLAQHIILHFARVRVYACVSVLGYENAHLVRRWGSERCECREGAVAVLYEPIVVDHLPRGGEWKGRFHSLMRLDTCHRNWIPEKGAGLRSGLGIEWGMCVDAYSWGIRGSWKIICNNNGHKTTSYLNF